MYLDLGFEWKEVYQLESDLIHPLVCVICIEVSHDTTRAIRRWIGLAGQRLSWTTKVPGSIPDLAISM